jgi:hypothetical protein
MRSVNLSLLAAAASLVAGAAVPAADAEPSFLADLGDVSPVPRNVLEERMVSYHCNEARSAVS